MHHRSSSKFDKSKSMASVGEEGDDQDVVVNENVEGESTTTEPRQTCTPSSASVVSTNNNKDDAPRLASHGSSGSGAAGGVGGSSIEVRDERTLSFDSQTSVRLSSANRTSAVPPKSPKASRSRNTTGSRGKSLTTS